MNLFKTLIKYIMDFLCGRFGHHVNSINDNKEISITPEDRINLQIKEIDALLNSQLNEIFHHPEFRALEAAWRGLHYLLQDGEAAGESVKVRLLNITKGEFIKDFERSLGIESSFTFQKIYKDIMATPGEAPFGLLLGAYEFSNELNDIELLDCLSYTAELAHVPFISAAAPRMFGCESYGELGMRQELLPAFSESIHQAKWNLLRSSESSKFVGLCLPHILLRQPYDFDERNKKFNFREDSGKTDLLWGNAAFAFAACVMRAFDERGWLGSISGAGSDGEARALPVYSYEDRNQCCTDAHISPKQELALTELGFLPLFENSLDKNPAFLNGYPLYEEKHCRPVRTLPYIFALSRIAHYLLAIARDRPEPFSDKEICEKELGTWLYNYTNTYDEEQNDDLRPLSRARIDVSKIHGRPGKLQAVIHLSFSSHLLEELPYGTRLVVDLP